MTDKSIFGRLAGLFPDLPEPHKQNDEILDLIARLASKPKAASVVQNVYSQKEMPACERGNFIQELAQSLIDY